MVCWGKHFKQYFQALGSWFPNTPLLSAVSWRFISFLTPILTLFIIIIRESVKGIFCLVFILYDRNTQPSTSHTSQYRQSVSNSLSSLSSLSSLQIAEHTHAQAAPTTRRRCDSKASGPAILRIELIEKLTWFVQPASWADCDILSSSAETLPLFLV